MIFEKLAVFSAFFSFFLLSQDVYSQTFLREVFVSNGNELKTALRNSQAGDDIILRDGVYNNGPYNLRNSGTDVHPIRVRSENLHRAIVRGRNSPTHKSSSSDCFVAMPGLFDEFLRGPISWVIFQGLKFENCWAEAVRMESATHFAFIDNHITGSNKAFGFKRRYIRMTHHFKAEGNFWDQDGSGDRARLWREINWAEAHHGRYRYYNGTLLGGRHFQGGIIFRHNYVQNAFNVLRITANSKKQGEENVNADIHNNHFFRIRDNSVEPEDTFENWWISYNNFDNSHGHLSFTEINGGHAYIFGNIGRTHEEYGTTSNNRPRAIKFYIKPPYPNLPIYKFHNSWWIEQLLSGHGGHLKHWNNAYSIPDGTEDWRFFHHRDWLSNYEFDYDVMSFIPSALFENGQESHGLAADPEFRDPVNNDFRLTADSPAREAGRPFILDQHVFENAPWEPDFTGRRPDAGAFQNDELFKGPKFREQDAPYDQLLRIAAIERPLEERNNLWRIHFTRPLAWRASYERNSPIKVEQKKGGEVNIIDMRCRLRTIYQVECESLSYVSNEDTFTFSRQLQSQSGEPITWWGAPYEKLVRLVP